jgi:hypothetical protein
MAGIDPRADPRGARWEARLNLPVLLAAWLAIPTVLLYFSSLKGWWAGLALGLAWSIWVVFVVEAIIMLSVVKDRRAWAKGHAFGLAIIAATFPLLTSILEGLLAARALSSLQGVRILQVLYLAKAAKLIKSWMILRKSGRGPRNPALLTLAALVCATALVGIGDRIVSGDKHPTPFHGAWDVVSELTLASLAAVLAAGALVAVVVARRRRRGRIVRAA